MSSTVLPRTGPAPALRGRLGAGFSPVPHRYHLYLAAGCPRSEQVAEALSRLGLADSVATTVLGADPEDPDGAESPGHSALRLAYEAAGHHFDGPLAVPALCDTWSGRVVSNHTPGILDDLRLLAAHPAFRTDRPTPPRQAPEQTP
ncbi:hypothetical protein [Streptomyces subrutilus]|uniref:GST N-terminal domain-containing protein n=1 Tax=Streptomyces subrutilus TaxID=36818 RepID=A0A5P2UQ91_9ACTN|nr:hypothetical protein [Streptomyces subrutilus]QEU81506.1 hypothetical protein CP968_27330 [Streptomyces subrutilus]WSJ29157.1 hypothetical protein OG479_07425 [Streptomyces subrutilus]GGZ88080.1 hypothetical protein GCM10010371_54960 [Streptomyces subrutilus]